MHLFIYFLGIFSIFIDYAVQRNVKNGLKTTRCMYYNQTICDETGSACNTEIECDHTNKNVCYVLWSNSTNGTINVIYKGCFIQSGDECIGQNTCVEKGSSRHNEHLFCCCEGDMCNEDFYWIPTLPPPTTIPAAVPDKNDTIAYFVLAVFLFSMFVALLIMFLFKKRKFPFFSQFSSLNPHSACPPSPTPEKLRPIQLLEVVARGKYGAVWKGVYNSEPVAVKIISALNKGAWLIEQEVLQLPMMDHENIVHFIGAEKHGDNLHTEFWLITSFHELGSLQEFLRNNVVTWDQLCHISLSIARGLTHLHEEIPADRTDYYKPAVAHRDFKSNNVLLKSDLTACIADFGLALVFKPFKLCGDTHGQVGTWRYMAPEVLEGAINFSMDAFFRIDMYACGLVLWELANRCSTHKIVASDYKLPFEEVVGQHPSLEEIQDAVVNKKLRPMIKPAWRRHTGFALLSETIEECWDQDAEARISACCIVERLSWYTRSPCSPDTDLLFGEYKTHDIDELDEF